MARTPEQLRYAPTHEWVDIEGDIATVGISSFAVAELTDLVFMALPSVGKEVAAGEEFGEVESVKAVSPLYAPISGTVIEANDALVDKLETLSDDSYEAGWMIRLRVKDASEINSLLTFEQYQTQCGESS